MPEETILVTGGAGYVGAHLVPRLLERGYRVRVLDNFLYGDRGIAELRREARVEICEGDICNRQDVQSAVRGARAVIALAAVVGDAACDLNPQTAQAVNLDATRLTLDACRDAGVSRLVFASSCSVYGANGSELLSEDSHLNPVSLYAKTRVLSERVLLEECGPVEVVILRLATVCGLSRRMRFDLMVNTITARAVIEGRVRIVGARHWRPHLHVQDAADAFARAAEAPGDDVAGSIFNVGSEQLNFTIGEIADRVRAQIPETSIEYGRENGDARSYRVSFDRIRDRLGFIPSFTVDDAIREVRTALRDGAISSYTDDVYHNVKSLERSRPQSATA